MIKVSISALVRSKFTRFESQRWQNLLSVYSSIRVSTRIEIDTELSLMLHVKVLEFQQAKQSVERLSCTFENTCSSNVWRLKIKAKTKHVDDICDSISSKRARVRMHGIFRSANFLTVSLICQSNYQLDRQPHADPPAPIRRNYSLLCHTDAQRTLVPL